MGSGWVHPGWVGGPGTTHRVDTVWVAGPRNHPLGSQWGGFCRTRSGIDLGPYIIIYYSFILNRLELISIFLYSFYIAL